MSGMAESSTAAIYSRDDDAMTHVLRSETDIGIDQLVGLHQLASPATVATSSAHPSTAIFSSKRPSTVTKPTSAGTSYPVEGKSYNDKRAVVYESSLSATHGSSSENEREAVGDAALVGIGDWIPDQPTTSTALRGATRGRRRNQSVLRRQKQKKPVVIIQQERFYSGSEEDNVPPAAQSSRHLKDTKYINHRREKRALNKLNPGEEDRIGIEPDVSFSPTGSPITRTRRTIVSVLIAVIGLILLGCTFLGLRTGKNHMHHTKAAIFAGTVAISSCTVFAMVVAARGLHESLLAGVLLSLFGFALLLEIGNLI